jgi:hypothetical protein
MGIDHLIGEEAEGLDAGRSTPKRDAVYRSNLAMAGKVNFWETNYHVAS